MDLDMLWDVYTGIGILLAVGVFSSMICILTRSIYYNGFSLKECVDTYNGTPWTPVEAASFVGYTMYMSIGTMVSWPALIGMVIFERFDSEYDI
jgi:hypothetical protein